MEMTGHALRRNQRIQANGQPLSREAGGILVNRWRGYLWVPVQSPRA